MKIEYEIKGITLDVWDLINIHRYYEAACTAEFVMENYEVSDEDQALQIGYDVRRLMDRYDCSELEAIDKIMEEIDKEEF